jgi:hypothetical protein
MEECDNKNFGYLIYDGDDFSFIKVKTNIDMDFNPYTKHVPIKFLTKLKTSKLGKTTKRGTSKQTRGTTKKSRSHGTTKQTRGTSKQTRGTSKQTRGTTKKSRSHGTTKQTRGTTKRSLLISSKEVSLD